MDANAHADMLHYVVLIRRGQHERSRAEAAVQWYVEALGAVNMSEHHAVFEPSNTKTTAIHHTFYLRIGPPGRGIILQVRDSFGNQGQNIGNLECVLSSMHANVLRDHIMNIPPPPGLNLPNVAQQNADQQNGDHLYTLLDSFGFKWIIMSTQLLPNEVFQWQNNPEAAVGSIHSAHLIYLVDRPRAIQASEWLGQVFGFVLMHDFPFWVAGSTNNIVMCRRRYMRLGDGNRRVIIVVDDAIRPLLEVSDDHSFSALYSSNPVEYYNTIFGAFPHGHPLHPNRVMRHRHAPGHLFVSKIRDPFGFHWFIQETMPNLLNDVDHQI